MQDLSTQVHKIISEFSGRTAEDIAATPGAKLDDLGLDSLDFVEVIMAIEDEFEIQIDDSKIDTFVNSKGKGNSSDNGQELTVAELIEFVQQEVTAAKG